MRRYFDAIDCAHCGAEFIPRGNKQRHCCHKCALTAAIVSPDGYYPLPGKCWPVRSVSPLGYGQVYFADQNLQAHRLAWQIYKGGETPRRIKHTCGSRNCANPAHLTTPGEK